jgi:hypothetical protein
MRTLLALISLLTLAPRIDAFTLAKDGQPQCVIHLSADAIPAEKTAAKELADYLHQITGATFEIKSEVNPAQSSIEIGATKSTRELLPDVKWDSLAPDTIILRADDKRLILAGARPRGTLYAVYTLLEDHLGVRWWTHNESFVPSRPSLEIAKLVHDHSPRFQYRESYHWHLTGDHFQTAVRFKVNGHSSQIPEDWGGHYDILGWCHTAFPLLPPRKYFKDHPNFYSMRKDKRSAERTQLCWTNQEMQKELARNALAWIRKNPSAGFISISQNDWQGFCECEKCKAIDDANGGAHAASLLVGVNAVAADVRKEFPGFLVETLAYQYTRKPPTQVKPADNVLVRLCSIECDFSHPLSGESNQTFGDDLRGWSKIAKNLFIWNYVTNFSNYLIPHPNYLPLAEDLRFFADHNVVGVFEQADCFNQLAGDMLPLRAWVQAHLLWDPSLDQDKLTDEFLRGYYGPAAPMLRQYLDLINSPAKEAAFRRTCYQGKPDFLSDDMLNECGKVFDDAERAVADDQVILQRVKRERLAVEYVALKRTRPDQNALADFCQRAKAAGVKHFDEGRDFESYASEWMQKR